MMYIYKALIHMFLMYCLVNQTYLKLHIVQLIVDCNDFLHCPFTFDTVLLSLVKLDRAICFAIFSYIYIYTKQKP